MENSCGLTHLILTFHGWWIIVRRTARVYCAPCRLHARMRACAHGAANRCAKTLQDAQESWAPRIPTSGADAL